MQTVVKHFENMRNIIIVLLTLALLSCKPLAGKLILGVDTTPEWKSNVEILNDFDKYDISEMNRFVLDTAVYSKNVEAQVYKNIETMKSNGVEMDSLLQDKLQKSLNDNLQPVQIRYFDSNGKPIFKLVNCYLENVFKMDWNFDKSFDVYPPSTNDEMLNFGNENLEFFLPMFKNLKGDTIKLGELPDSAHYAIVFWNDFFKKPSKKLIKKIQNIEANRKDTFVFYVNNHNSEIYDLIPEEQKKKFIKSLKK
jgi:hypothetical protein